MCVEGRVPRLHSPLFLDGAGQRPFQFLALLDSSGLIGVNQVVQQLIDITCIRSHTTLQHVVGISLVSQQLCYLAAQVNQSFANRQVVFLVVVRTHGVARHVELFSQLPLRGIGHEGRVGGHIQGEHPSLLSHLLRCQGGGFTGCLRQSVQLCLVGDVQVECLVLLQQVLRELQAQHGGLLRQFPQFLFSCLVEQGTATYESLVAVVEQHLLLGSQLAVVQVYLADSLKQAWVQPYIVGMLCQDGLYLLCQRIHLVVGLSTQQVEEHGAHARQQVIVALILLRVDDGVVEGRLLRVVDSLFYLLVVAADAFHEGFLVVLQADTVKGHGVVRCVVRF